MGCIEIIIWIFAICIVVSLVPYIGIVLIGIIAIKVIIRIIKFIERRRSSETNCKEESHNNTIEIQRTKYSKEQLERFMKECNAQLEHDEEMQQYKEYYNIKDDD